MSRRLDQTDAKIVRIKDAIEGNIANLKNDTNTRFEELEKVVSDNLD